MVPDAALRAVPPVLAAAFPPSESALLDLLRVRVDEGMLREMAAADYGNDAEAHLAALRRIRDTGTVPAVMRWEPQEVLELTRWAEPDGDGWEPHERERGHRMRAFACATLLRAGAEPANAHLFGESDTLAQLVASTLALGEEAREAAARFLAWRAAARPDAGERPFVAFALLLLAVLLRRGRLDDEALAAAAGWASAEEAAAAAKAFEGGPAPAYPWLLRVARYDQRADAWRGFARRLLDEAPALGPAARELVQLIAESLLGPWTRPDPSVRG